MNRRSFLKKSLMATTGTLMAPAFLRPFEGMAAQRITGFRNLVVIQLSGGNDGLNTIVPYGNDIYYRSRSAIGIEQSKVIRLDTMQGFNPALAPLREIYDQGWMNIVNDVGYPNPDRSHFRSMDIWQTASDSSDFLNTGWIGRYLDSNCEVCSHPYSAVEVDDVLSLALKGSSKKGIAVKDPAELYRNTSDPFFRKITDGQKEHLDEDNLGYLYKTMVETASSARYIRETSKLYTNSTEYPNSAFGKQLKTVAQFILSGLQTRVYYVSLSGFDTHVNQNQQQERLLTQYAEAVSVFIKDLKAQNQLDNTLIMTFSEFGRRVQQNASRGTDHGTANNMLLFGGKLRKPGIFNSAPDLGNLENGDLRYQIDFREVYSTVLSNWLSVSESSVLGKSFVPLPIV